MWQAENQTLVIDKIAEILRATDQTYAEQLTRCGDEPAALEELCFVICNVP